MLEPRDAQGGLAGAVGRVDAGAAGAVVGIAVSAGTRVFAPLIEGERGALDRFAGGSVGDSFTHDFAGETNGREDAISIP